MQGTNKFRLLVETGGLGWHARSFCDEFDVCSAPDGRFVTLFHSKREEPLEKIAKAFFARRWNELRSEQFRSLAVSRFLAATLVGEIARKAFPSRQLVHYPGTRLIGGASPMFADGNELWLGYRFFSENAYWWARQHVGRAARVVAIYFADTKYQFRTDLPPGTEVRSITELDISALRGEYSDLILTLLRGLQVTSGAPVPMQLTSISSGELQAPPVTEADVHEALAALNRPCASKGELRYQLAAGVVLNAWIEDERKLGFNKRKKFYAFKQRIGELAIWASETKPTGVRLWTEACDESSTPILFIRIDDVDFSFHAIPTAHDLAKSGFEHLTWTGMRLKPIASSVLAWARSLLSS